MSKAVKLRYRVKGAIRALRLLRPFKPLSGIMLYWAYLPKVDQWCRDHGDALGDSCKLKVKTELYEHVFQACDLHQPIDYLEFGVFTGASFRWWLSRNQAECSRFVGFDTFTGLPEKWGHRDAGHFGTNGRPPKVDDARASFEVGMFQSTLADFLERFTFRNRKVIHLDADLYSSTLFVLTRLAPHLNPGDVIIFDEFLAWRTPEHEFRAFCDFMAAYQRPYELLGASNHFAHVALQLTE